MFFSRPWQPLFSDVVSARRWSHESIDEKRYFYSLIGTILYCWDANGSWYTEWNTFIEI